MKVFVHPLGLHSRAMVRVADALVHYAPADVIFSRRPEDADVQILHAIGHDALATLKAKEYVIIQYCMLAEHVNGRNEVTRSSWADIWDGARFVWSYYDLQGRTGQTPFYFAPLGVDEHTFRQINLLRDCVMTSGYVSGPGAEPIEEMSLAAEKLEMPIIHLGPHTVEGMKYYPKRRTAYLNIEDDTLCRLYNQTRWVSGMRYVEGFELPVLEGLACGARPIVFDRPDMRQWYNGHVVFVPETSGLELQQILQNVLQSKPFPVTMDERNTVLEKFNWRKIAVGFWRYMGL
jgi:hypothetical protein